MKQQGFSLVELIITLVILGTLAVTVVPKFFTNESFDAYEFRDRTLTVLRVMQLRAMQNTNDSLTHKVCFSALQVAPAQSDDCAVLDLSTNSRYLNVAIPANSTATRINTADSSNIAFSELSFDDLGKTNLNCTLNCKIDFGEADICISDQGGIYACQ